MDLFEGPTDIFGMALYNSLTDKVENDPKYREFVNNLNEKIVVDLDYYPVMLKFEKDHFEVTRKIEDPTIKIKVSIQNYLNILEGKTSILGLFFKGKLKIKKGLTKILKVYKLFSKIAS
ncbi:MAG: SCP2 sterol-binding domain-containing protein [Candidatus Helarchaeota archaeon]